MKSGNSRSKHPVPAIFVDVKQPTHIIREGVTLQIKKRGKTNDALARKIQKGYYYISSHSSMF